MGDQPELPIPISLVSDHYLLFSINAVTYLRREYHICGVLSGTLPHVPQQNVFLGLPLELMPEEARLLVEKGVAYIVDEFKAHDEGIKNIAEEDRRKYLQALDQEGREASRIHAERKDVRRESTLKRLEQKNAAKAAKATIPASSKKPESEGTLASSPATTTAEGEETESLFNDKPRSSSIQSSSRASIAIDAPFAITPATSYPPLTARPPTSPQSLPPAPPSYPLFAHLHSKGYFLSPGLRFGCQYLAYPGDPLRFHSHFLTVAAGWDEEVELMTLVAGGRLGTGVKKGFLIGGAETGVDEMEDEKVDTVRTFSVEWAGM